MNDQLTNHDDHHARRTTKSVEKLEWSDALLLRHGPMDDEHREFVQVVTALRNSTAHTALAVLDAVEKHLIRHFDLEHMWMEKTGFPEVYSKCHRDQHDEVLGAVFQVHQLAAVGQIGLGV
uniref:hemerythrin n=1 Tax=Burkholderia sp. WTPI3 TaxID=2822167 RepID=UPI001F3C7D27